MPQINLRADEVLAASVRRAAADAGLSVNAWMVAVLRAATDPEFAGSEAERIRERLRAAGLLAVDAGASAVPRPDRARARDARAQAGAAGLSEVVRPSRR